MNINRYTEKAQEALAAAQGAAEQANHPQIDPEHLLAALLAQPGGVVPDVLRKLEIDPGAVGADVQQGLAKLPKAYGTSHAGFSARMRAVLQKAEGELARAGRLLGRAYSIGGRVMRGDGLGRKLGFPTANVQMKHNRPPLAGIFAVRLHGTADGPLRGVASLGVRPTVKQGGSPVLEVHVLDFQGDLYRRQVRVEFLHKFRDEEKYADLATLTKRIALDVENAREYFRRKAA